MNNWSYYQAPMKFYSPLSHYTHEHSIPQSPISRSRGTANTGGMEPEDLHDEITFKEMLELSEKGEESSDVSSRLESKRPSLEKVKFDMLDTLISGVEIPTAAFLNEYHVGDSESVKEDTPSTTKEQRSSSLSGYTPLPAIEGEFSRPTSSRLSTPRSIDSINESEKRYPLLHKLQFLSDGNLDSANSSTPSTRKSNRSSEQSDTPIDKEDKDLNLSEFKKMMRQDHVPLPSIPKSIVSSPLGDPPENAFNNEESGSTGPHSRRASIQSDEKRSQSDTKIRIAISGVISKNPVTFKVSASARSSISDPTHSMVPSVAPSRRSSIIASFVEEEQLPKKYIVPKLMEMKEGSEIEEANEISRILTPNLPAIDDSMEPDDQTPVKQKPRVRKASIVPKQPRGRKPSVIVVEEEVGKDEKNSSTQIPEADQIVEAGTPKTEYTEDAILLQPIEKIEQIISKSEQKSQDDSTETFEESTTIKPLENTDIAPTPLRSTGTSSNSLASLGQANRAELTVPLVDLSKSNSGEIGSNRSRIEYDTEPDQLEQNYQRIHTGEFYRPQSVPKHTPKTIPDGVIFYQYIHDPEKRTIMIREGEHARYPTFSDRASMDKYLQVQEGTSPLVEQVDMLTSELDQSGVPIPSLLRKRAIIYCRLEKYAEALMDFDKSTKYGINKFNNRL
jgi:hypothetical protein